MKIKSAELEIVCGPTSKLPVLNLPQVAFAGRSNVGKSSLINTLLNRKSLARTSQSPGKTRTINFYNINRRFYFADLPGYGYAKTSKQEQAAWGRMVEKYLATAVNLKAVFLLVDVRHEAKASDLQMFEWVVSNGFTPVIVATKADKLKKNELNRQTALLRKGFRLPEDAILQPFSALNKSGKDEIWKIIEDLVIEGGSSR